MIYSCFSLELLKTVYEDLPRGYTAAHMARRAHHHSAYDPFWTRTCFASIECLTNTTKVSQQPKTVTGIEIRPATPSFVITKHKYCFLKPGHWVWLPHFTTSKFYELRELRCKRLAYSDAQRLELRLKDSAIEELADNSYSQKASLCISLSGGLALQDTGNFLIQRSSRLCVNHGRMRWKDLYAFENYLFILPQTAPRSDTVVKICLQEIWSVIIYPAPPLPSPQYRSALLAISWVETVEGRQDIKEVRIAFEMEDELNIWAGLLAAGRWLIVE